MNFVLHGKITTSESLPCQSRVARQSLPCLIALPYLIQILIQRETPYFCHAYAVLNF